MRRDPPCVSVRSASTWTPGQLEGAQNAEHEKAAPALRLRQKQQSVRDQRDHALTLSAEAEAGTRQPHLPPGALASTS